jgi:cellulose synthase operon protein YhjQ
MDHTEPEQMSEEIQSETPEDVAVLYSWAKLQGAKYRDFSASRREYRAQMRHRAAEGQRESERRAQTEAEATAAATEKAAREAEETARFHESAARQAAGSTQPGESAIEQAAGARAMQAAADLARRASAERLEAARRAEAVAAAEAAARREEREMAEAHASARRQAQQYAESEIRRRDAAGPQPIALGGQITDPYTMETVATRPDRIYQQPLVPEDDMQPSRHKQSSRDNRLIVAQPGSTRPADMPREYRAAGSIEREAEIAAAGSASSLASQNGAVRFYEPSRDDRIQEFAESRSRTAHEVYAAHVAATPFASRVNSGVLRIPQGYRPDEASDARPAYESRLEVPAEPRREPRGELRQEPQPETRLAPRAELPVEPQPAPEQAVPAWIYSQGPEPVAKRAPQPMSPVEDTLQHSRERVASRWFALKGVFDHPQDASAEAQPQRAKDTRAPLLTVFSLAGGVGKTSLVATLGRALSSTGERVLLTDTTSHGLLPFYFGASELRPGAVRTFSPPAGSPDAPIYLVSYDVNQKTGDAAAQEWLDEEMTKNGRNMQRVLVDLTPGGAWVARKLARMNSTMLVPVAPDMNSVISLQGVEKFFAGMVDGDGRPVSPFYLLNQFDASLPLHLDVREVMRQQLGERLLPFAIRRSPGMSEALAEGMTVMDYAPESAVAADYMNLVSWLRAQSAPAATGFRNARWSER